MIAFTVVIGFTLAGMVREKSTTHMPSLPTWHYASCDVKLTAAVMFGSLALRCECSEAFAQSSCHEIILIYL